jgi:hypothetical protein
MPAAIGWAPDMPIGRSESGQPRIRREPRRRINSPAESRRQTERVLLACLSLECALFSLIFAIVPELEPRTLAASGGLAIFSLALFGVFRRVSLAVHTTHVNSNERTQLKNDHEAIRNASHVIGQTISLETAVALVLSIAYPARLIVRITETVEPLLRSSQVATSITFDQLPSGQRILFLPLLLGRRGVLLDGLNITDDQGRRISSMAQDDAAAVVIASVMRIMRIVFDGDQSAEQPDSFTELESRVVELASSDIVSAPPLIRAIRKALAPPDATASGASTREDGGVDRESVIAMVEACLSRLQSHYPLLVAWQSDSVEHFRLPRFRVDQRIIAGLAPSRPASSVEGRISRTTTFWRRALGVRPAVILAPLSNAARCRSYHLEIKGPSNSYLARQRPVLLWHHHEQWALTSLPDEVRRRIQRRRGQRLAHLYIRGGLRPEGKAILDQAFFQATFFERTPGSIGQAALSALAGALLVLIAGLHKLGLGAPGGGDVLALLLGFPVGAAAWVSLDQAPTYMGGTLASKVISLSTVGTCILAVALFLLGPAADGQGGLLTQEASQAWFALIGLAGLNAAAAVSSWTLRAKVEEHFAGQKDAMPHEEEHAGAK